MSPRRGDIVFVALKGPYTTKPRPGKSWRGVFIYFLLSGVCPPEVFR